MSARLRKAWQARLAAVSQGHELLRREYPIGAPIRWRRGDHPIQNGKVTAHSEADAIKVRNQFSQREYWIHVVDILEAM